MVQIMKTELSYILQHTLLSREVFIIMHLVHGYSQIEILSLEESDW